jgi:hypothetical protein
MGGWFSFGRSASRQPAPALPKWLYDIPRRNYSSSNGNTSPINNKSPGCFNGIKKFFGLTCKKSKGGKSPYNKTRRRSTM